MDIKKFATAFGVVLTLIGVLGFVPALTPDGQLLGIFAVDPVHNVIHLATGLVALAAAKTDEYARTYFKVFGVVYALVTILGFTIGSDGELLGIMVIDTADNFLHVAITLFALYLGFGTGKSSQTVQA